MINILHGVAALLFGILLELFAGNWYVVLPFSICVLNKITEKFSLPWVFLCGFLTGLVMDLIYWRAYPGSALATAFTVLTVRLAADRSKIRFPLLKGLLKGAITGVLSLFLMALFNGYADGRRVPRKYHLVTSFCGAVVIQVLLSRRKGENDVPERKFPQDQKGSGQNSGRSGKKKSPSNANSGSGRSRKKKQG